MQSKHRTTFSCIKTKKTKTPPRPFVEVTLQPTDSKGQIGIQKNVVLLVEEHPESAGFFEEGATYHLDLVKEPKILRD